MKNRLTGKLRSISLPPSVKVKALRLSSIPFLDAISVVVGIWDTINGAKKMKEGSSVAKEMKELVKVLDSAKQEIVDWYAKTDSY